VEFASVRKKLPIALFILCCLTHQRNVTLFRQFKN